MPISEYQLDNYVKELQPSIKNIIELEDKLGKAGGDIDSILSKLNDEGFDLGAWLGDNLFRTDNPKRKETAIQLLNDLNNELSNAKIDLNILKHDIQDELNTLLKEYGDWKTYFDNRLPFIAFSIAVPKFQAFNPFHRLMLGFVLTVVLKDILLPIFEVLGLGVVGLIVVVVLIDGIIQGEKRMELFENIQKETKAAMEDVKKLRQDINDVQVQVNAFFEDVAKSFQETGMLTKPYTNHQELVSFVKQQAGTLRRWSDQYDSMKRMINKGLDIEFSAEVVAANLVNKQDDENELDNYSKLLMGAYLIEMGEPNSVVSQKLDMSLERIKKVKATYMLFKMHTPDEIAQVLEMDVNEVMTIQETNSDLIAIVS
ncbi:hypothetical protein AAHH17_10900 [Lysinibacillus capsici]|uniref:hypothetical protein n=1 Tax=Lysinibacillus TaxID=400634 RepID=UPI001C8C0B20|nr:MULTISPECIES: hypothetical protein [Lysinibacillus]MBX8944999.1 hypothetical protein [Lysinibacillus sp. K60]MED4555412.1 hypothetical protein [Lysinibacillus capsici]